MTDDRAKLIEALASADKLREFLAKLQNLITDGSITEEQYQLTKPEYDQKLSAARQEIAQLKEPFKKKLENSQREIETFNYELRRLEIRYKVEELSTEEYTSSDQKVRTALEQREAEIKELKAFLDAESTADIPKQLSMSPVVVSPSAPVSPKKSKSNISQQHKKSEISTSTIPKPEPFYPANISLKNLHSLFSLRVNYRSWHRIVCYVVVLFLLISLFLLPWAVGSGFSFSLTAVNVALASGCTIFSVLYLIATFIPYRGLRGLAHIAATLLCILLWLVFFFTTFQQISRFSMSPGDMLSYGAILFIAACVLGIITGILETFVKVNSNPE